MKIKKKQKKYIDLSKLDDLVPTEYRDKIDLLFNKDLRKEIKNADDLLIHRLAALKETDMQQYFNKEVKMLDYELKQQNKFNEIFFVQNDNGDGAAGHLNDIQRMALFARKKREGSKAGFPDATIFFRAANICYRDTVYCEVKRIGAPSDIHITEEQLEWFLKLNDMGFDSYITNNPIFFKEIILGKIKSYFVAF